MLDRVITSDRLPTGPRPGEASHPRRAAALPPAQRRAAIVTAAAPLVRAQGRSITTRAVADAAGIAEGTIFRVFATKDELIDAVVERVMDHRDTVAAIDAIDTAEPLAHKAEQCAQIILDRLRSVMDLMMALHGPPGKGHGRDRDGSGHERRHGGGGKLRKARHARRHQQHADVMDAVARVLEPSAAQLTCPPRRAAELMWAMAFTGRGPMAFTEEPVTADEIASVLLHGVLSRPDPAAPGSPATPGSPAVGSPATSGSPAAGSPATRRLKNRN